jgi:hypothetical protein
MSDPIKYWIRGWLPSGWRFRRTIRMRVVVDRHSFAQLWTLELHRSRDRGPTDTLLPDPRMKLPDQSNAESMAAFFGSVAAAFAWAWARDSFPHSRRRGWTVRWCLYDAGGAPAAQEIQGGSLGAAFGVGLAYLFGLGQFARRRLDPNVVISAGLSEDGTVLPVDGLQTKVRAVDGRRSRFAVAAENETVALNARISDRPAIESAGKAGDVIRLAAAPRHRSVLVVATVAAIFVGAAGWWTYQQAANATAQRAHLVQQWAAQARQDLRTDPALAALSAAAAVRMDPSDLAARTSLEMATNIDSRLDRVVGTDATAMALSPDGTTLATGGADRTVTLRSLTHVRPARTVSTGGGPVTTLAFSRDSHTLFSGDTVGNVVWWNVADPGPVQVHRDTLAANGPVSVLAVSPDARRVAVFGARSPIAVVDTTTGTATTLPSVTGSVASMVFIAPDTLIVGLIGYSLTNQLLAFDLSDPHPSQRVLLHASPKILVTGISALAVSGDGSTLVSGDMIGQLTVWDAATLAERRTVTVGDSVSALSLDPTATTAVVTTVPGQGLAPVLDRSTASAKTQLWDLRGAQPLSARSRAPSVPRKSRPTTTCARSPCWV